MILAAVLAGSAMAPTTAYSVAKRGAGGGGGYPKDRAASPAARGIELAPTSSHAAAPNFRSSAREAAEQRAIEALVSQRGSKEERTREFLEALKSGTALEPDQSAQDIKGEQQK